tara:strand:+ start:81 stop:740 length:660 start_codon:yes stop_codon:yes gene_type:complete
MTYLEAVNKVLRRLREPEVGSVDETVYSKLIGEFVSDAKSLVENAWSWSGNIQQNLTVGTSLTDLTIPNSTVNTQVRSVRNIDTKANLKRLEYTDYRDLFIENLLVPTFGPQPEFYATQFDFTTDSQKVYFWPPTEGTKTFYLNVRWDNRGDDVLTDSSTLSVPSLPVVQFAHAMAVEERGETGGTTPATLFGIAKSTLSDAVAYDAAAFPSATTWVDV